MADNTRHNDYYAAALRDLRWAIDQGAFFWRRPLNPVDVVWANYADVISKTDLLRHAELLRNRNRLGTPPAA